MMAWGRRNGNGIDIERLASRGGHGSEIDDYGFRTVDFGSK